MNHHNPEQAIPDETLTEAQVNGLNVIMEHADLMAAIKNALTANDQVELERLHGVAAELGYRLDVAEEEVTGSDAADTEQMHDDEVGEYDPATDAEAAPSEEPVDAKAPPYPAYFRRDAVNPVDHRFEQAVQPQLGQAYVTPYGLFIGELEPNSLKTLEAAEIHRMVSQQILAIHLSKFLTITPTDIASVLGGATPLPAGEHKSVVEFLTAKIVTAASELSANVGDRIFNVSSVPSELHEPYDEGEIAPDLSVFDFAPRIVDGKKLRYIEVLFAAAGGAFKSVSGLLLHYGMIETGDSTSLLLCLGDPAIDEAAFEAVKVYLTWRAQLFAQQAKEEMDDVLEAIVSQMPVQYVVGQDEAVAETEAEVE